MDTIFFQTKKSAQTLRGKNKMILQEVNGVFIKYQDEKHKYLMETQKYFLKNKFQPYIWIDENHRLRIKHKFYRGKKLVELFEEMTKFEETVEKFSRENRLLIRFSHLLEETDYFLPEKTQSQWSMEYILEVKR